MQLCDIPVSPLENESLKEHAREVTWDRTSFLKDSETGAASFELSEHYFLILRMLCDKGETELEIRVSQLRNADGRVQNLAEHDGEEHLSISVNLYGPHTLGRSVGAFLQVCGLYLQNPDHCGKDVPYINPHCLTSAGGGTIMTSVFQESAKDEIDQKRGSDLDIFMQLGNDEEYEEAPQPKMITTMLHK